MDKSYYLETYGCQMNVADTELIEGILHKEGYSRSKEMETADAIFVNTCAIREHAEQKVHSRLGNFKKIKQNNPGVIIGVLGCMAQNLKDDLLVNKPYVDIILGPDSYRRLPNYLRRNHKNNHVVNTKLSRFEVYDDLFPNRNEGINAWVSIMRGCDKFCTFCIVPFTRGRERSRSIESILTEVSQAVADGFVEITLLGQNVNSYRFESFEFWHLLEAVASIDGVERVRYTSPHPQDVTEELLDVMTAHDSICNSIHFPLQAGSDNILKRMNRTYTKKHFLKQIEMMRKKIPTIGISTDIIVGFPGESEMDFQETLDVMNNVQFDSAFTFKYSARPYTKAVEYENQISENEKQNRLDRLIRLQREHTLIQNKKLIGTIQTVMVEKESKKSQSHWAGRTDTNKWVIFPKEKSQIKNLLKINILNATGSTLHGEMNNHHHNFK
jgi:tRNA-2-methylthio-N6-dimethylallyladenosine synthase